MRAERWNLLLLREFCKELPPPSLFLLILSPLFLSPFSLSLLFPSSLSIPFLPNVPPHQAPCKYIRPPSEPLIPSHPVNPANPERYILIYKQNHSRLSAKNNKLARPTLGQYIVTRDEAEHYVNELFAMMSSKDQKFDLRIHEIYPLEDVARAHRVSFGVFLFFFVSISHPSLSFSFSFSHHLSIPPVIFLHISSIYGPESRSYWSV